MEESHARLGKELSDQMCGNCGHFILRRKRHTMAFVPKKKDRRRRYGLSGANY